MTSPDTDALLARIAAKRDDIVALTQTLVRTPTLSVQPSHLARR
ncbi:MAG: hypothetical protein Q8N44_21685 [Rubrivivax sp.]|nr:hypothetical protein [Rubrivivax sp.]MDP3086290.1 hypothetical protein [Rubrivivax sp.]